MRSHVVRLLHSGSRRLGSLVVWGCCVACEVTNTSAPDQTSATTSPSHSSSSTNSSPTSNSTSSPIPANPSPVTLPNGQPSTTDGVVTSGGATTSDATTGAAPETSAGDKTAPTTAVPDRASNGETTKPNDEPSAPAVDPCMTAGLEWRSARKTNYESYPEPGSEECIEFNGCTWEGLFAACDDKMSEQWVSEHNIVAAFPDFEALKLHDLCLRKGDKTIVVTVYDTCGDSDCDGCCTENKGNADQLIDLEKYTNERWGVPDGTIEWADLGPTTGPGCE